MEQAELCYGQDASLWLACPDLGVGPGVESAVPRFASRSVGSLEAVSQSLCSPPATTAEAGVFFVHGTLKSRHDATLHNADVRSEITDHTRGYVLSQVAAFNGVARCYVPHYRQSTFFPVGSRQILRERFDVAYGDVLAAFEAFLAFHQGPFFLASHSQGSVHALRLLRERFDDSLRQRLVAAYCPGVALQTPEGAPIPLAASPAEIGALRVWNCATERCLLAETCVGKFCADAREPLASFPFGADAGTVYGWSPVDGSPTLYLDVCARLERRDGLCRFVCGTRRHGALLRFFADARGDMHAFDFHALWLHVRRDAEETLAAFLALRKAT